MNGLNILLPPFFNTDPIACVTFVSTLSLTTNNTRIPESQQLFWDYSLAISFISISCPIPPYEHPFARCLLSDFLLPYTERFDVFNENHCMLIVLWWADAIDISNIILSNPPFHWYHHSSIASSCLCRYHHTSWVVINMIPPVTWGYKPPRNVEQTYIETISYYSPSAVYSIPRCLRYQPNRR